MKNTNDLEIIIYLTIDNPMAVPGTFPFSDITYQSRSLCNRTTKERGVGKLFESIEQKFVISFRLFEIPSFSGLNVNQGEVNCCVNANSYSWRS